MPVRTLPICTPTLGRRSAGTGFSSASTSRIPPARQLGQQKGSKPSRGFKLGATAPPSALHQLSQVTGVVSLAGLSPARPGPLNAVSPCKAESTAGRTGGGKCSAKVGQSLSGLFLAQMGYPFARTHQGLVPPLGGDIIPFVRRQLLFPVNDNYFSVSATGLKSRDSVTAISKAHSRVSGGPPNLHRAGTPPRRLAAVPRGYQGLSKG